MIINGHSITSEQLAKVYDGRISLEPIDKDDVSCHILYWEIDSKIYKIELNSQEYYAYYARHLNPVTLDKLCLQIGEKESVID